MKTREIILEVQEYHVEKDPFTIKDGIAVILGFLFLVFPLLFLSPLTGYNWSSSTRKVTLRPASSSGAGDIYTTTATVTVYSV